MITVILLISYKKYFKPSLGEEWDKKPLKEEDPVSVRGLYDKTTENWIKADKLKRYNSEEGIIRYKSVTLPTGINQILLCRYINLSKGLQLMF
jgi:hypothetical protein